MLCVLAMQVLFLTSRHKYSFHSGICNVLDLVIPLNQLRTMGKFIDIQIFMNTYCFPTRSSKSSQGEPASLSSRLYARTCRRISRGREHYVSYERDAHLFQSRNLLLSCFACFANLAHASVSSGPHPSDYAHALSAYFSLPVLRSASGAPCQPGESVITHLTHRLPHPTADSSSLRMCGRFLGDTTRLPGQRSKLKCVILQH